MARAVEYIGMARVTEHIRAAGVAEYVDVTRNVMHIRMVRVTRYAAHGSHAGTIGYYECTVCGGLITGLSMAGVANSATRVTGQTVSTIGHASPVSEYVGSMELYPLMDLNRILMHSRYVSNSPQIVPAALSTLRPLAACVHGHRSGPCAKLESASWGWAPPTTTVTGPLSIACFGHLPLTVPP